MHNPYPPELIQWARDTSHRGFKNSTYSHVGEARNKSCGDAFTMKLFIDEGGKITHASFDGEGCSVSLSSAAALCSSIEGHSVLEAKYHIESLRSAICEGTMSPLWKDFSAIYPFTARHRCGTLITEALEQIIVNM